MEYSRYSNISFRLGEAGVLLGLVEQVVDGRADDHLVRGVAVDDAVDFLNGELLPDHHFLLREEPREGVHGFEVVDVLVGYHDESVLVVVPVVDLDQLD